MHVAIHSNRSNFIRGSVAILSGDGISQTVLGPSGLISQLLGAERLITATFFATTLWRMSVDPLIS